MRLRAPLTVRQTAREAAASGGTAVQRRVAARPLRRAAPHGHDLARIAVGAPIQRANGGAQRQPGKLLKAYTGVKGAITGAAGWAGRQAGRAAAWARSTRLYRGTAAAGRYVKGKVGAAKSWVKGTSLAQDIGAIHEDLAGMHKLRTAMGVLGLAGGYQQGHYKKGAQARGAFRERWEKYFASIPDEDRRAAAMEKFSLPPQKPPRPDPSLGDIEMQDVSTWRGGGGGRCPTGGGQADHPRNRFDEDSSGGGGNCSGVVALPENRFGNE